MGYPTHREGSVPKPARDWTFVQNALGLVGLVLVVLFIAAAAADNAIRERRQSRELFEKEAIQHGAGTYDSEGKFKWISQQPSGTPKP